MKKLFFVILILIAVICITITSCEKICPHKFDSNGVCTICGYGNSSGDGTEGSCIVTFDTLGGSKVARQTLNKGEKITQPMDPAMRGCLFIGWYKDGELWNFDTDTVDKNITLTAGWLSYIHYNTNGGVNSQSNPDVIYSYGTYPIELSAPTRQGYKFLGWYYDANFTTPVETLDSFAVYTLYARWERIESPVGNSNFPWEKTTLIFQISENSDNTLLPSSSRRYLAGDLTGNETDHSRVDDYVKARNDEATAYTNVNIEYQYLPDTAAYDWGQNINVIYRQATGGNPNAPDVFINFVYDMVAASLKGAFANLYSTSMYEDGHALAGSEHNYFEFEDNRKYQDTGKDYMYTYMRSLTLSNHKMYCLASDYLTDLVRASIVIPVNIDLLEIIVPTTESGQYNNDRNANGKYDIDDFYQLVWDMQWNYETLACFANEITLELGGEGFTIEDRVGFALGTSSGLPASGMLYSNSISIVKRYFDGSNGDFTYWYPYMQKNSYDFFDFNENYVGPDGRYDTTFEQLDTFCDNLSALVDNDGVITVSSDDAAALGCINGEAEVIRKKFASNQMLFGGVIVLGALEHDDYLAMKGEGKKGYGIAPIPLYHTDLAEDETYSTQIHNNGKIAAISYGTRKFAQCTAYLDYQSTHSSGVLKEYYNHKLKATVQPTDTGSNTEMLTYIREHVGSNFDKTLEDALAAHYNPQHDPNYASTWHNLIRNSNFQLDDIRTQYAEIARLKAMNLYDLENYGYPYLPE